MYQYDQYDQAIVDARVEETDTDAAVQITYDAARYGHDGYILRAFEKARIADPDAVLFLNEYNQESVPAKGARSERAHV